MKVGTVDGKLRPATLSEVRRVRESFDAPWLDSNGSRNAKHHTTGALPLLLPHQLIESASGSPMLCGSPAADAAEEEGRCNEPSDEVMYDGGGAMDRVPAAVEVVQRRPARSAAMAAAVAAAVIAADEAEEAAAGHGPHSFARCSLPTSPPRASPANTTISSESWDASSRRGGDSSPAVGTKRKGGGSDDRGGGWRKRRGGPKGAVNATGTTYRGRVRQRGSKLAELVVVGRIRCDTSPRLLSGLETL